MHWNAVAYAMRYPMAPLGGLFVGSVGVFVLLGAAMARYRIALLWLGFGAGIAGLVLGARLQAGLPNPSLLQAGALGLAIALESVALRMALPRLRAVSQRAAMAGCLGIVGLHFFIMLPTFGVLIALLALLCTLNAAAAWRLDRYPLGLAWFADGIFKIAIGSVMLTTSPYIWMILPRISK